MRQHPEHKHFVQLAKEKLRVMLPRCEHHVLDDQDADYALVYTKIKNFYLTVNISYSLKSIIITVTDNAKEVSYNRLNRADDLLLITAMDRAKEILFEELQSTLALLF